MTTTHASPDSQVGYQWLRQEVFAPGPLEGLAAILDKPSQDWDRCELPLLAHWLYFLPRAPQSELGTDGHPMKDEVVPPPDQPRRMWAGGRVEFYTALRAGSRVARRSTIAALQRKRSRSGPIALLTLQHELRIGGELAIRERQDLVYRAAPTYPVSYPERAALPPRHPISANARQYRADSMLLFRFSALTFNAHRIHYDRDYCRDTEGYPGLVVHGPLLALLMIDQVKSALSNQRIASIEYRNLIPIFDGEDFMIDVKLTESGASVAVTDFRGSLAATATACLHPPNA